jgi:hypothetical protein
MKNFLFKRESNDFTDILSDKNIKKEIKGEITFLNHLILGIAQNKNTDKVTSYLMLKYGEDMMDFNHLIPDRTPVPLVDYFPERKKRTVH